MTGETRALARFVAGFRAEDLPEAAHAAATRQFLNYVGCALGGAAHDATERTFKTVLRFAGGGTVSLLGRSERLSAPDAALVNCQASAAHAFDDTHLATVIHPAGPIAAPLLAEAERRIVSGRDLHAAFALGVEVACRVGMVLTVPPAEGQVGWYMTSVATPIGAAAAVAHLLKLDEGQILHAIGLGAAAASGFRQTHGSMCTSLLPAQASRAGYMAALLAAEGVTASEATLEGDHGFAGQFAPKPHLPHLTADLGQRWAMRDNMPKPYPCGIVIHPILDACLEIAREPGFDASAIERIDLKLNPLCLTLTDRPAPPDAQLAQVSLQHWTAAALVRKAAGIAEGTEGAVGDSAIQAVRAKITATPDEAINRDGADVTVVMADGVRHHRRIEHGVGSLNQPMSDAALEEKFMTQAASALPEDRARDLLALSWRTAELEDASAIARAGRP